MWGDQITGVDSLEKTFVLERLRAGWEGADRGWDGWMKRWMETEDETQWTWVWANSRR